MRRVAAISVLLAFAAALAGCGKGGYSTGAAAKQTAGHSAAASNVSGSSIAKARAFAHAVNLRASDVPGFHPSSEHEHQGAAEKRLEPELLHCVGSASASKGILEAGSKDFERADGIVSQSVSSEVTVARTPALAAGSLAAFRSRHLRACLTRYFNALLKTQNFHGATVGPVSARPGSPPALGTAGSFGLRLSAAVSFQRLSIRFYMDILGFVDGSAEVSLFTFGVPRPFPANIEEQLFTLLVERAKANSA
jgi:hypothetical protein